MSIKNSRSLTNTIVDRANVRWSRRQAHSCSDRGHPRSWVLALFLALVPLGAQAVDQLNLFELDQNFVDDDSLTTDSCGWGTHPVCGAGWTDNVGAATFDLIDGLIDINEDTLINTNDTGTVTVGGVTFDVIDGFIDYDMDNKVNAAESGAQDSCYYLGVAPTDHDPGGCFGGLDILFGYVDFNEDGTAPSEDGGNDAESLLNGNTNAFKYFFGIDDTSTRLTLDTTICDTGIPDVNGSDCTIYTGGGSKDPEVITEYEDRAVISGLVDINESGGITSQDDLNNFGLYKLKDGYIDVDGDGIVPEESDDGEYLGLPVIDGRIVIGAACATTDIPGSLASGAGCDGTIDFWVGGWEWSENNLQPKNDINSAFAGTWLYETDSPGTVHLDKDFILYYGMDIAPSSGSAAAGFWLMQDETVGLSLAQGQTNGTRQWVGSHTAGDLLIQINPANGVANVFVWNPDEIYPGLPANDPGTPNLSSIFTGTECVDGGNEQPVCAISNQRQEPVPTDPSEWPYEHELNGSLGLQFQEIFLKGNTIEGGLNVSAVYRKLGISPPCFATSIVSTRSTESTTGTLTDFMQASFESCSLEIRKTGDAVAIVGDTVTFNIEIENSGLLPLYLSSVSDSLVDGQSGADTTLNAALAAGCDELKPREICSFPLTYTTDQFDDDPFQNTISAVYESADGLDSFTASDDHWVDLVYVGSIGNQVWLDENGNGVFDAGEDGVPGVTVILTPPAGVDIGAGPGNPITTTTDANGQYLFNGLPGGDYTVDIVAPSGMVVTYDYDGDLNTGTPVTLADRENNTITNFGLNWVAPTDTTAPGADTTGAIGDRIWNDADGDGLQDEGEAGVANVGVVLTYDSDGDGVIDAVYGSTVTDSSGNYIFDDLPLGIYEVTVIGDITSLSQLPADGTNIDPATGGTPLVSALPAGYIQTGDPDEVGVCSVSCDNTTSGPLLLAPGDVYVNADFGYQDASGGTAFPDVSGTVYLDANVNGGNDTFGGPDSGVAEVSVSLALDVSVVDGLIDLDRNTVGFESGMLDGLEVINGKLDLDGDGVITGADDGYFGGVAVIDGVLDFNANGTAGAGDTGSVNVIVASTTTDENGAYEFQHVEPGFYSVIVSDANGSMIYTYQTGDPDEAGVCVICDSTTSFEVSAADVGSLDFGYTPIAHEAGEGLISGTVGLDTIDDDLLDENEGTQGVDVVLYQLFDVNNGLVDLNNDGLVSGDTGYVAGTDVGLLDGYRIIDGQVDTNNDGVIDANDDLTFSGCGCVFEGLTVQDGTITTNPVLSLELLTDTTNSNGVYTFSGLDPDGQYSVETVSSTLPAGTTNDFDFSGSATDGVSYVDLSTVSSGVQTGVDFGLEASVPNTLSGVIWNDVNADGTLTAEETAGFADVTVELYDSNGQLIATTMTCGGMIACADGQQVGEYSFDNLASGTYTVKVTDEYRVLTGYWLSDGPNDGQDNNSQTDPYTLTLSGDDVTADFGYFIGPASVGNSVFNDINGNGLQEAGEPGFAGVEVILTITYPSGGSVVMATTTDEFGNYTFGNLLLDEDYNGLGTGQPTYTLSVDGAQPALTGYLTTENEPGATDDSLETVGNGEDLDSDTTAGTSGYPVQGFYDDTNDFGFHDYVPIATDDSSTGNTAGSAVVVNVTANDTTGDIVEPTTVSIVGGTDTDDNGTLDELVVPGEGTWTVDPVTGAITFTPEFGYSGDPTPISYTVEDAEGNVSNPALVTVTYVRIPPTANDDSDLDNTVGTNVTLNILANDTLFSGDPATPATTTVDLDPGTAGVQTTLVVPGEGTWTYNDGTGELTFDPEAGFTTDPTSISYTLTQDLTGLTDTALVTVTYVEVPPVANDDASLSNAPATTATVNVLTNDTLSDGTPITNPSTQVTIDLDPDTAGVQNTLVVPGEGTWSVDPATGILTFTPEAGFTGDPTPIVYELTEVQTGLTDTATVTADYVPVASNDADTYIAGLPSAPIDILANDTGGDLVVPTTVSLDAASVAGASCTATDLEGDCIAVTVPGEGVWTVNETNGQVVFTPEAGFTGDPTPIDYTVEDAEGNVSNAATITLTAANTTLAQNDINQTPVNVPVSGDVLTNDSDAQGDTQTVQSALVDTTGDGIPDTSLTLGSSITVAGVDEDGLAVLNAGTLTLNADGTYTFVPNGDIDGSGTPFTGTVSAEYTVTDDNTSPATDDATLTIKVYGSDPAVNDPPVAQDDTNTTEAGVTVSANVITPNDSDPDGDPLTVTAGKVDTTGNGIPDTALIVGDPIQVAGVDLNGNPVTNAGTLTLNADGSYTFVPNADIDGNGTPFTGTVVSDYTISDGNGGTDSATLTITVLPDTGNATYANDDANSGVQGVDQTGNILANDSDPEADDQDVGLIDTDGDGIPDTTPVVGTPVDIFQDGVKIGELTLDPETGDYTWTPEPDFVGTAVIPYTATDGTATDTATLYLTTLAGTPPVAVDDESLANTAGPVTLNALDGSASAGGVADSDPDGNLDPATVDLDPATAGIQDTLVVSGEGTWTVDASGNVTFTPCVDGDAGCPAGGYTDDPTPIPYTVSDTTNLVSNEATITIDYVPVATPDSSTGNTAGTPVTVDVTANDTTGDSVGPTTVTLETTGLPAGSSCTATDVSGDCIEVTVPGEGVWTANETTGAITFTPEFGYSGDPTPISYTVDDDQGNTSNSALVTVTYNRIPPTANDNSDLDNAVGTNVTLNILSNDTVFSGDPATTTNTTVDLDPGTAGIQITLVVPGEGTWTYDAGTGNLTFDPEDGFTTDPTPISYELTEDLTGLSDTALVTVTYTEVPPVADNDASLSNDTGTTATVNVLTNDTLSDGTAITDPSTQVTIDLDPGSVGVQDTLVVTGEGIWNVDPATGGLTFTPCVDGDAGCPAGGYTQDPTPITYELTEVATGLSDTATVTVDYVPVASNDADTYTAGLPSAPIDILGNDIGGDVVIATTVSLDAASVTGATCTNIVDGDCIEVTVPGEGVWTVDETSGEVVFTPEAGFGADPSPIDYTVEDAEGNISNRATITLTAANTTLAENDINQTPVNVMVSGDVLTNDSDAQGDGQTVTALLMDTDGDGLADDVVATGVITEVYGTDTSGAVVFAGWLAVETDGSYTFGPALDFTGTVPAVYTVTDDNADPATDTATLKIEVFGSDPYANDSPVAQDDTNSTEAGVAVSANVIVPNDSDPDGDALTVASGNVDTDGDGVPDSPLTVGTEITVAGADNDGNPVTNAGTLTLNADGSYTFAPNADIDGLGTPFTGTVVSDYTISDGNGGTDSATLTITVVPNSGNNTFANDDANSSQQGVDQTGNLLVNDNDPEGDFQAVTAATDSAGATLTVDGTTANTLPSGGTLVLADDGTYTYSPDPAFVGTEVVVYEVCDSGDPLACDTATLYLTTFEVLVPDVTPVITVQPNVMSGPTSFEVWVECVELLERDTTGTITLRVPKDNRWTMTLWDPSATTLPVTGFTVNNVEWTLTQDATAFIFTTNTVITGGTQLNFGFSAAWDAAQTSGTATYTVNIVSGSGGEVRTDNNSSAASADYTF